MRKEVIFAVILGAILGLIVAAGAWRANSALRSNTNSDTSILARDASRSNRDAGGPTPTPPSSSELSIQRPLPGEVSTSSEISVAGLTKPNSKIVINAENSDYFYYTDQSGSFDIQVDLIGGINNLIITSSPADSQFYEKPLAVVFTTAVSEPSSSSPTPVTSADPVRQKLQEKLDSVSNKPMSVIGTVTDKTESGIQVKNGSSEIKQISISSDTSFVRVDKTTKDVAFADLGIGDYIAAVGYNSASNLFDAKRIIITTVPDLTKRKVISGNVASFTKQQLKVTVGNQEYTVPSNRTLKVISVDSANDQTTGKFSDIKAGDSIIVSGTLNGTSLEPRTIYLIRSLQPSPASNNQ